MPNHTLQNLQHQNHNFLFGVISALSGEQDEQNQAAIFLHADTQGFCEEWYVMPPCPTGSCEAFHSDAAALSFFWKSKESCFWGPGSVNKNSVWSSVKVCFPQLKDVDLIFTGGGVEVTPESREQNITNFRAMLFCQMQWSPPYHCFMCVRPLPPRVIEWFFSVIDR